MPSPQATRITTILGVVALVAVAWGSWWLSAWRTEVRLTQETASASIARVVTAEDRALALKRAVDDLESVWATGPQQEAVLAAGHAARDRLDEALSARQAGAIDDLVLDQRLGAIRRDYVSRVGRALPADGLAAVRLRLGLD